MLCHLLRFPFSFPVHRPLSSSSLSSASFDILLPEAAAIAITVRCTLRCTAATFLPFPSPSFFSRYRRRTAVKKSPEREKSARQYFSSVVVFFFRWKTHTHTSSSSIGHSHHHLESGLAVGSWVVRVLHSHSEIHCKKLGRKREYLHSSVSRVAVREKQCRCVLRNESALRRQRRRQLISA